MIRLTDEERNIFRIQFGKQELPDWSFSKLLISEKSGWKQVETVEKTETYLVYYCYKDNTTILYNGLDNIQSLKVAKKHSDEYQFDVKMEVWINGSWDRDIQF